MLLVSACASRPGTAVDAEQLSRSIDALRAQLARQDERLEALTGQVAVLQSQPQGSRAAARDVRDLEVVRIGPQKQTPARAQEVAAEESDDEPVMLEITGEGDKLQIVKMPPAPKRIAAAPAAASPSRKATPVATSSKTDSDPALAGALESYREARWEEAYERFSLIVEKSGKTDKAAQAQYWMGESRFDEKRYNEAIEEYQKLIANYPNSGKLAEAKFKIGVSYEKMRDESHARAAFQRLIEEHPDAAVAELARARPGVKPRT